MLLPRLLNIPTVSNSEQSSEVEQDERISAAAGDAGEESYSLPNVFSVFYDLSPYCLLLALLSSIQFGCGYFGVMSV